MAAETSPTPYVCDLPGWGADGSSAAAQEAAVETATTVNAGGRDPEKLAAAVAFATEGWPQESPDTPHKVKPDIRFYREIYGNGKLRMYDGTELRHWGFEDEHKNRGIPSPLIRVREGQIVHTELKATKGPHTIHHHGIEPDAHNDGVGHTSFDVNTRYTYQWRATEAGTYFYHCHVNTPLHVQLGLFGGLIVDPETGPGTCWKGGPVYDHERFWVGCAFDPTWAALDHHAGVDGADVGLNRLNPKYFLINDKGGPEALEDPDIAVRAKTGETILMRLLNANYHPQRWTWDADVDCVCSDGRPFEHGYPLRELTMCPAERYDMILRPRKPGVVRVKVETLHWITGKVLGSAETLITVSGQAIPDPPKPPSNPPAKPYPPGPASPYPSAPAAQPPAPAPAATPSQPLKASVKGKKVVSKAKRKPKKLSLRERLRRRKRLQAKAKAKAKAKGTATRKPGAKKASPAKRSSRKR
jgi:FtsP/CotA-like multicopper oxidase with cupredoxin domain